MEGQDLEVHDVIDRHFPIFDILRIKTRYPNFQKICFGLSIGFHIGFTACLSVKHTPFKYFAHHVVWLVLILIFVWVICLLLVKLAKLLDDTEWFSRSVEGSLARLAIDSVVTIGLAVGSSFISCELTRRRHLSGIVCLLVDLTLLELSMLEDKDFYIGDAIFSLASCVAFVNFKKRWYGVAVIIIFLVRKVLLFGLTRKKLNRERGDQNRAVVEREAAIRREARAEADRNRRVEVLRMREQYDAEITGLVNGLLQDHAAEITALQERHAAVITTLQQEHAAEIAALQQGPAG